MRATSQLACESIKASGKLSDMRWRVYDFLYRKGPLTGRELDAQMAGPGETWTSYHQRLRELERMGLAQEVGERHCFVTGNLAIIWDATGATEPVPFGKPKSRHRQLYDKIRDLAYSHPVNIPTGLVIEMLADEKGQ